MQAKQSTIHAMSVGVYKQLRGGGVKIKDQASGRLHSLLLSIVHTTPIGQGGHSRRAIK